MIIRDKKGVERIAMAYDFQDVTITFTPAEWKELLDIFSCHKKEDTAGRVRQDQPANTGKT